MNRIFGVIILLGILSSGLKAQSFELGLFGGTSNYGGDLAYRSTDLPETKHAIGVMGRYNISPRFVIRLGFNWGVISGSDEHSLSSTQYRNLHFRSNVFELAFIPEFNLLPLDAKRTPFTPFFFAGIAGFHFNPMAQYNGEWVELQPLTTEGQNTSAFPNRSKYALTQISVPMGGGFKLALGGVNLAFEMGFRKTFTDYLDDVSQTYVAEEVLATERGAMAVALSNRGFDSNGNPRDVDNDSQRGNPTVNDYYVFSGMTVSFLVGYGSSTYQRSKSNYGCPSMW